MGSIIPCSVASALAAIVISTAAALAQERDELLADLIFPAPFSTLRLLAPQIYSVVRGTVDDIHFEYDDCLGPRTVVRFREVEVILGGALEDRSFELRDIGGPLPNGVFVGVTELPRYVLGGDYVLVLRNTDWRYSAVIGDLAFRAETVAGKEVLVNTDGFAASGVSELGIETRTPHLTEAVGLRLVGNEMSKEVQADTLRPPHANLSSRCPRPKQMFSYYYAGAARGCSSAFELRTLCPPCHTQGC